MGQSRSWSTPLAGVHVSFPAFNLGLDSRQPTPELVTKITIAGVKDRSAVEAARTLEDIGGVKVSPKTVERVPAASLADR